MEGIIFIAEDDCKYIEIDGVLLNVSIYYEQSVDVSGLSVSSRFSEIQAGWQVFRVLEPTAYARLRELSQSAMYEEVNSLQAKLEKLKKALEKGKNDSN